MANKKEKKTQLLHRASFTHSLFLSYENLGLLPIMLNQLNIFYNLVKDYGFNLGNLFK